MDDLRSAGWTARCVGRGEPVPFSSTDIAGPPWVYDRNGPCVTAPFAESSIVQIADQPKA